MSHKLNRFLLRYAASFPLIAAGKYEVLQPPVDAQNHRDRIDTFSSPIRVLGRSVFVTLISFALFSQILQAKVLSPVQTDEVIESLVDSIERNYVSEEVGSQAVEALVRFRQSKAAGGIRSAQELEQRLNGILLQFDRHLSVEWRGDIQSGEPVKERWFSKLKRKQSGITRVEILEGNIGYIDFWGFDSVNMESRQVIGAAMKLVANTDALIFDLRKNGGGSQDMVRHISSYLFEDTVHLNSIYWRFSRSATESWTKEGVSIGHLAKVPVYILTSHNTFSAAEEFAYNLQQLKRATIVGETTKGGANPWRHFALTQDFRASIPVGRAVNPITKMNWENVGVQPDVATKEGKAYFLAYRLALQTVKQSVINTFQLEEIDRGLVRLGKNLPFPQE